MAQNSAVRHSETKQQPWSCILYRKASDDFPSMDVKEVSSRLLRQAKRPASFTS
jgi:hypothetical protein